MKSATANIKTVAANALKLYKNYKAKGGKFKADVYKYDKDPNKVTIPALLKLSSGIGCKYADFFRQGERTVANLTVGKTGLKRIRNQMDALGMDMKEVAGAINVRPGTLGTFLRTGYHPAMTPEKFEALLNVLQVTPAIYAGKEGEPEKQPEPVPEQKRETQQDLFSMEYPKPGKLIVECGGKWYRVTGWQEVSVEEVELRG